MGRAELRNFQRIQRRKAMQSKDVRIRSLASHIAELQRDGVLKKPSKVATMGKKIKSFLRSKLGL